MYKIILSVFMLSACCCLSQPSDKTPDAQAPAPQLVSIRLLFTGDVMQHLPQVAAAQRGDGFDYRSVFESVSPRFHAADLVIVNLETTLTRTLPYTGYPCFRSPLALAEALHHAGADVALLANNHCCDGGAVGIRTTTDELSRCDLRHTGVFADSLDYRQNHPLYLTRRGIRVALLNYTYDTNGIPVPKGVTVNRIDTLRMASDLAAAQQNGADCRVVCIHWGVEYQRRANAEQRALADFLRRHGADLIIGSHPHVVQPYEADSTHVVLYSLGNFVSNQRKRFSDGGLMAEIDVTKHPDGRMAYSLHLVPVWVSLPGYRILPPEVADTMALPATYRRFRTDVEELLGTAL